MSNREFQHRLKRRATRAGVVIGGDLGLKLEVYFRLLTTWNRKINLTGLSLDDPTPESLDRLLIEPLAGAKYVSGRVAKMIDIGSGGGSPAIPFALAVPGVHLLMVEAKTRKSVFLREVIRALEMTAEVETARFEMLLTRPDLHEAHDLLTIRAVRIEARVLMSLQALVKPRGELFLFRSAATSPSPGLLSPPIFYKGTFPLLETLRSEVIVLEKRRIGR